nr:uncharacterized protein LOC129265611 [Lytechinus pictus]
MEATWIANDQITATSSIDKNHAAHQARLYGSSSWRPDLSDTDPFIEITLQEDYVIKGLIVQGGGGDDRYWVKEFSLEYGVQEQFVYLLDPHKLNDNGTNIAIFEGNSEYYCVKYILLPPGLITDRLRLRPIQERPIALRMELLGCLPKVCNTSDTGHEASPIFLTHPLQQGDISFDDNGTSQYWSTYYSEPRTVTRIVSRKCLGIDGLLEFDLRWSNSTGTNSSSFFVRGKLRLVYYGTPWAQIELYPPIDNVYQLRIYPTMWTGNEPCLQLKVFACPTDDECTHRLGMEIFDIPNQNIQCRKCVEDSLSMARLNAFGENLEIGVLFPPNLGGTSVDSWLQVRFPHRVLLSGIILQSGSPGYPFDKDFDPDKYTYNMTMSYQPITAANDTYFVVAEFLDFYNRPFAQNTITFGGEYLTTAVRLKPVMDTYRRTARFAVEFIGCPTDARCRNKDSYFDGACYNFVYSHGRYNRELCSYASPDHGSHLAYIKSPTKQRFVQELAASSIPLNALVRMGLEFINSAIRWLDGNEITFEEFSEVMSAEDNLTALCGFMEPINCYQWRMLNCSLHQPHYHICEADFNECLDLSSNDCSNICVNMESDFYCKCPHGLRMIANSQCEDVCEVIGSTLHDDGPPSTCIFIGHATWEVAYRECIRGHLGRFATQEELFTYSYLLDSESWWTIDLNTKQKCRSFNVLSREIADEDCKNAELDFLCLTEYQYIQIEDAVFTSLNTNFTASLGYLGFTAHSNNYDQTFYVQVDDSLSLRLTFLFVSLRENQDGNGDCLDYVSVEDLVVINTERRKICGSYKDITFFMNHHIRMKFFAQSIFSLIQFSMTYEAIDCEASQITCESGCGTTDLIFDGTYLQTDPFPSSFIPFSSCEANVTVPDPSFILITIDTYGFREGSDGLCQDRVILTSPEITLTFSCDDSQVPGLIITNSSTMTVAIETGRESLSTGLQARINSSDIAGCAVGTDLENQDHLCTFSPGIIASRLFPEYVEGVSSELWFLQAPSNAFIEIVFDVLSLSDGEDCSFSRIEVIDHTGLPHKTIASFCSGDDGVHDGMEVAVDVDTVVIELMVNFHYDNARFLAHYRFVNIEEDEENWESPDTATEDTRCPEGWVLYSGHCYHFTQVNGTWTDAEEYCTHQPSELSGSHMVSIMDSKEAKFIHGQLILSWSDFGQSIYIGLGNRDSASMFRWTNGSPMTYTDWFIPRSYEEDRERKQPDGGSIEKCTIIILSRVRFSGLWRDVPCALESANAVICKMEATTALTNRKRRDTSEHLILSAPVIKPNCSYNTFECGSGECVQQVFQNDGEVHCHDRSDEDSNVDHTDKRCEEDQFKCLIGGQCISISFVCDHISDCTDGSDEFACIFPSECSDDEFFCSDVEICIDASKRCNLVIDCPTEQGGDEFNCQDEYYESGNVQCYSGTWLPSNAKCDGLVDCIGNEFEDEEECGYLPCIDAAEFQCLSEVCIDISLKCIYELDELGYVKGCRDVSHLRRSVCAEFDCPAYHYKCPSSYCIPLRYRCDSINHCPYGEDEDGCTNSNVEYLNPCPTRSYKCHNENKCISPYEVCDGIKQCSRGDDELFCDVVCPSECTCTGLTIRCNFVLTDGPVSFPHDTRKIVIGLNYDVQLKLEKKTNSSVSSRTSNQTGDNHDRTVSFWPSDYMSLVELDISGIHLKEIPETAFLGTRNLRYLNISGNTDLAVSAAVLYNLTRLHVLDIFGINIKSSDPAVSEAFKALVNLQRLRTDEFGFCCLAPATLCEGYTNQFSSCDDLLKDVSLRAFMWILGLSALLGNAMALAARFARRKQAGQNQIQVLFITHLALSDLLMGLYMIVIAGADSHYRGNYALHAEIWTSSFTCKMAGFLSVLSSEVSVLLVMLISIDRFLSVVFPLKNELHLTLRSAYIMVIASWTFSLLLSLIPALPVEYFGEFYGKSSVCLALPLTSDRLPGWEYSIVVFICTNFICFILTFLCYFVIYISVRKSHMRIKSLGAASNSMMKEQIQMTTKMALVVGTDFVCWMPIIIMGILATSNLVEIPADIYAWTAVFILPLNSALNPYLYTLSTVLQRRRKARENTDSMSLTQTTKYSVEQTQREERLMEYCIISHTSLKQHRRMEPITDFFTRRGGSLDDREERLVVLDLRRALCHLRTLGADEKELIPANVAVERDHSGNLTRAFFVMTNPLDISRFIGPSSSNEIQTKLSALFDQIQDPLMTPVKQFINTTTESFDYDKLDEA